MKIVKFIGAVLRARHNASILLENSKVEVIVNIWADDEYGV